MAGSKIFLEPILSKTVASIDQSLGDMETSLQNVKQSVDAVPGKIDDQITELQNVVDAVGDSIVSSNIAYGDDNEIAVNNSAISVANNTIELVGLTSFSNGTIKLCLSAQYTGSWTYILYSIDGGTQVQLSDYITQSGDYEFKIPVSYNSEIIIYGKNSAANFPTTILENSIVLKYDKVNASTNPVVIQ